MLLDVRAQNFQDFRKSGLGHHHGQDLFIKQRQGFR